jgi:multidrug resistance efflux pump
MMGDLAELQRGLSPIVESPGLRVVDTPSWIMLTCSLAAALILIVVSSVVTIDTTGVASGVLTGGGGTQPIVAPIAGVVRSVVAPTGTRIAAQADIVVLDSASTQSALIEANRRLDRLAERRDHFETVQRPMYARRASDLRARAAAVVERIASERETVAILQRKEAALGPLKAKGILAGVDLDAVTEEVAVARRSEFQLDDSRAEVEAASDALAFELDEATHEIYEAIGEAQAKRDALAVTIAQTHITAPRDGTVDGLTLRSGDVVGQGAIVGHVVPDAQATEIVAYLRESDRAFLVPGARATVELGQLPASEFGLMQARVMRISAIPASKAELVEFLESPSSTGAESGRYYRVALELALDPAYSRLAPFLRPGALVAARIVLRRRTLLSIVFEPVHGWLR